MSMSEKKDESSSTAPTSTPRKTGKVLWFNIEKRFGFIVPDGPGQKILYVDRDQINAISGDDDIQALQKQEPVQFDINAEKGCAEKVTRFDGELVDFSKKIVLDEEGPRYIILANPPPASAGPFGPIALPELEIASKVVKGRVVQWQTNLGWGFIQPDGEYRRIVAERNAIETDGYPGLKVGSRVQFIVTVGPYPNTVTATKVLQESGEKIEFESPFPEQTKMEPVDDTIHKGIVKWFGEPPLQNFGFLLPDDKASSKDKDDQVFVHLSETKWIPLEPNSKVEYKLGTNSSGKAVAVCVTGPDGGKLRFAVPNRNAPSQHPSVSGWGMSPQARWNQSPGRQYGQVSSNARLSRSNSSKKRVRKPQENIKRAKPKLLENTKLYKCDVCDKSMVGKLQWDAHCRGKTHKHKAEMSEIEASCTICNIVFSGKAHHDSHMAGKKHLLAVNPILFAAMYPDYERKRQSYSSKNTFARHWQNHRNSLVNAGLVAPQKSAVVHAAIAPPSAY